MNMQGKWRRKKKGRKRSVARKLQSKFWWGERKEREAVRVRAARETGCAGHDTITIEYQINTPKYFFTKVGSLLKDEVEHETNYGLDIMKSRKSLRYVQANSIKTITDPEKTWYILQEPLAKSLVSGDG